MMRMVIYKRDIEKIETLSPNYIKVQVWGNLPALDLSAAADEGGADRRPKMESME